MTYPNITPLNGVKETSIGKTVKSEFDGNYVQQRLKTTRFRKSFELNYALSDTEFLELDSFFQTHLGSSFTFTHPSTSVDYTVRFSEDTLNATYQTSKLIKVTLKLEEV